MTKQEVKTMIEDADCNGDSKLDYHEVSTIIVRGFEGYCFEEYYAVFCDTQLVFFAYLLFAN